MSQQRPVDLITNAIMQMLQEQRNFMQEQARVQQQLFPSIQQHQAPVVQVTAPKELSAEGLSMPKFDGKSDVADFFFRAKLYFQSKNIAYEDATKQQRPLSLLLASLTGAAASWYREFDATNDVTIQTVADLERFLTREFTAPDHQEQLRDQLFRLRQNQFSCLDDYVDAFRRIIWRVTDMSEIDKLMHFQKGLITEIREPVKLHQFRTTTDAITFALKYSRTHQVSLRRSKNNRAQPHHPVQRSFPRPSFPRPAPPRPQNEGPTPMEINNSRMISKEECRAKNLCFYCRKPGHRLNECK